MAMFAPLGEIENRQYKKKTGFNEKPNFFLAFKETRTTFASNLMEIIVIERNCYISCFIRMAMCIYTCTRDFYCDGPIGIRYACIFLLKYS